MGRKKSRFYKDLPKTKEVVDTNESVLEPHRQPSPTPALPAVEAVSQTVPSRRKQRQMESYIAKKLKKDARPALMERLHKASYSGEGLQSTKDLLLPSKRDMPKSFETREINIEDQPDSSESGDDENDTTPVALKRPTPLLSRLPDEAFVDINAEIAFLKRSGLNPLDSDSDSDTCPQPRKTLDSDEEISEKKSQDANLVLSWQTFYVLVERTPEISEQRAKLPIFAEEQHIMEVIRENPVVIICGETGSGKTTQIPQFLYEAGFGDSQSPNPGLIGVTQPRRVAATSMATRVGEELGRPSHVSYQIRYDGTVSKDTRIKFMTDGILLRELATDFLLSKYSIILLDEAHERNLNTDILIGMLSRVVKLRNQLARDHPDQHRPLRLVVMSATLNVEEFQSPRLFSPSPPIVRVDARQHPVTIHFARRTDPDHVAAAYRIVKKVHGNLPSGGILVFLTGKQEIVKLAKRLNTKYTREAPVWKEDEGVGGEDYFEQASSESEHDEDTDLFENAQDFSDGGDEFSVGAKTLEPLYVLPLYSLLAPEEQAKVFIAPPEGHRLCVLATNVAETSLTIPNIRYVVDSGLVKQRHFDLNTGAQEYRIEWTSQASAIQRAGRAGRVGPGHCYRLYSSAVFDQQFSAFSMPEMSRTPMEGLVLQLKAMSIDHPDRFPLPTPPDPAAILAAQRNLIKIGAVSADENAKITRLGRKMTLLPLAPLWSRLAIIALETNEAPLVALALASVMSVGDPFLDTPPDGEASTLDNAQEHEQACKKHSFKESRQQLAGKPPTSDLLMWLNSFLAYRQEMGRKARQSFSSRNYLMPKRLEEMHQQYNLLIKMMRPMYPQVAWNESPTVLSGGRPLRKLIAQSLSDRVAERVKGIPPNLGIKRRALPAYRIMGAAVDDPTGYAYLHPTSVLKTTPPPVVVYCELVTTDEVRYIRQVTAIESSWV